jgi:hypothetical protein
LEAIPLEEISSWNLTRVVRDEGAERPDVDLFSVRLPNGWSVRHARTGGDSWSAELIGPDFTISFYGGPFAVSELYEIVGGGPALLNAELAGQHIVETRDVSGYEADFVRPRDGVEGTTGMILRLPTETLLFSSANLSRDQQAIAFAIFSTVMP